jgi:large subunit ribosomal protein L22
MASLEKRAYIKGIELAPRKVSIVASLVRNRTVADALVILDHTPRRAALAVKKAIESAKANLLDTASVDVKTLAIKTISVTTGTRMRRYKPASRGRALPFEKKSSNILVVVTGEEKVKKIAEGTKGKEQPEKTVSPAPKARPRKAAGSSQKRSAAKEDK